MKEKPRKNVLDVILAVDKIKLNVGGARALLHNIRQGLGSDELSRDQLHSLLGKVMELLDAVTD